jgi:type IV pilus assembly protein PilV
MSTRPKPLKAQRGVALLEVLIAFLILSVGLVGFSTLQARALKATQSTLQRTKAVMLGNYILDSVRANKDAAITSPSGYLVSTKTCATPTATATLADNDRVNWFAALKSALGDADTTCADLNCTTAAVCTVNIYWDDSRALGGSATQTLNLVSAL